jgi:hypothetical protein
MGRKSKYVREKETLLANLKKAKLSEVTEEEINAHLETIAEDEALSNQLLSNWKRATTTPKARNPNSPAYENEVPIAEVTETNVEAPPPNQSPEIVVTDLGIRSANAKRRRVEEPVPVPAPPQVSEEAELAVVMGQCSDTLAALFLQQRSHFSMIQGELMSLRFSLSVLVGMCAATFFVANWGEYLMRFFASN